MELQSLVIGLVIGLIVGCIIGWLLGKRTTPQPMDLSGQTALLASLNSQVAEMRGKFTEIERSRGQAEQQHAQYDTLREQRLKEWMDSTRQLFAEQAAKLQQVDGEKDKRIQGWMDSSRQFFAEQAAKLQQVDGEKDKRIQGWMDSTRQFFAEQATKMQQVDGEKDKRIQDWMESTNKFFTEQQVSYIKFLEQQGMSREEIEQKRDAQIRDMAGMIQQFTRAIAGTKTRGMVGEEQLREALAHSIRAGVVSCELRTDSGIVEFAWNLEDGKYIPIDCKLPDVFELLDQYARSEDIAEQKSIKTEIIRKLDKEVRTVEKYQNQTNTIDTCILVVPEGILEIVPEIVGLGRESNVFVCSYKDVFPVAYLLQEKYEHFKEQGDVGAYRQLVNNLFQVLDKIEQKTNAIQTALTTITNANNSIKKQVLIARQMPTGIEIGGDEDQE